MFIKIRENIIATKDIQHIRPCKVLVEGMTKRHAVQIILSNGKCINMICNSEEESKELFEEIWKDM